MHTWVRSTDGLTYTVGHYRQTGGAQHSSTWEWVPMADFSDDDEASAFVSYLNGGNSIESATPVKKKA